VGQTHTCADPKEAQCTLAPGVDVLFTYSLEVKVMMSSVGKFHDVTTPTSSSLGESRSQNLRQTAALAGATMFALPRSTRK
jgi:hypothetical protein